MAKNVTYEINLVSSAANKAALKGLEDAVVGSIARIEAVLGRVGAAANRASQLVGVGGPSLGSGLAVGGSGSSMPDYSKQLEALDRFKRETESRFSEAGKSAREKFKESLGGLDEELLKAGEEAGRKYEEGFNRGRGRVQPESLPVIPPSDVPPAPTELPRESPSLPGGGPSLPDDNALDNLGKLVDKLGETRDAADETKAKLGANFREIAGSADQTAGAIGKLAGGLAFLFADSEDAKKLVQYILLVKGGIDTVVGTVQAASGVAKFFSLLGERAELKTKSQKLDTEATDAARDATSAYVKWLQAEGKTLEEVTAGNQKHAEMLRRVAAEADKAAKSSRELGDAQDDTDDGTDRPRRGRGSGRRRGFGKGKAGMLAGLAGMFGGRARDAVGDAADNALGSGASGIVETGLDNIGSMKNLGRVGRVAAPVASALALGKLGFDVAAGGGTIDPNSGSGKVLGAVGSSGIGGSVDRFLGLDTPAANLTKSFEDLERATKRYQAAQEQATQQQLSFQLSMIDRRGANEVSDFQNDASARVRAMQVGNRDMTATGAVSADQVDIAKQLNEQLKFIRENEGNLRGDTEAYVESLGRAEAQYGKLIESQNAMISAVKSEAAERERLNNQSISAAEKRMGLIEKERDIFRSAEEKVAAAAQRFAELSKADQAATLQAQQTAQQGGQLTKRQRQLLDSTGLGEEQEVVKRQRMAEAAQAGFFENFGGFERGQMQGSVGRQVAIGDLQNRANAINDTMDPRQREAALRELNNQQEQLGLAQSQASRMRPGGQDRVDRNFDAQAQEARVEIANRQEINIQVQMDVEQVTRNVIGQLKPLLDAQAALIEKRVGEEVNRDKTSRMAEANAAALARRNASKT
jgi:hypothetical protein